MSEVIGREPFSAALIAGGRSRRMGMDKALLLWEGLPLWQHQMEKLRALGARELFLSCRSEQGIPPVADVTPVADAWPDAGPLGGIGSCLRVCSAPLLVVLGIDLPLLPVEFLRRLSGECTSGCGAVVTEPGGEFYEPLAAVYPKRMTLFAEEQITAGRFSMQDFIRRGVQQGMLRSPSLDFEAGWFTNVNAPEDIPSHGGKRKHGNPPDV
jgi:molybdopterin-guanine dinucleotide biosynthesis protein A